jgi:WD40 repeat protein
MNGKRNRLLLLIPSVAALSLACGTLNLGLVNPQETSAGAPAGSPGWTEPFLPAIGAPTSLSATDTAASRPTSGPALRIHAGLKTVLDQAAYHVLFSRDGKTLFLGGGSLLFLDAQSFAQLRSVPINDAASGLALSPDDRMLAVLGGSGGISLIDAANGGELCSIPRPKVTSGAASDSFLAFTPDGKTLAAIVGEVVKLYDTGACEETGTIVANSPFNIAVSPDGKTLYAGGWMDEIQVWDIAAAKLVRTFGEKSRGANRMALSPDGTLLASAGVFAGPIILWDTATGRQVRTLTGHSEGVTALAFSADGRLLASAADDVTIKLWDTAAGVELQALTGHTMSPTGLAFSPDGGTLASAARDGTVRLWTISADGSEPKATATAASGPGPDLRPTAIPLSSRAITAENAASVQRMDILDFSDSSMAVWSPDGKWLIAGGGRKIHFLDAGTYAEMRSVAGNSSGLAVSPDSQVLAALDYSGVTLYDVAGGAELRTLAQTGVHSGAASGAFLAFSPDSASLAVVIGDVVKIFDVAGGAEKITIPAGGPFAIAVSPDGRYLYTGGWGTEVEVWDIASGALIRSFGEKSRGANMLALSPDGSLLVSAGVFSDPMILWDTASGRQVRTFSGHTDGVLALAFTPDGKVLVSASRDDTIRLWNVGGGNPLAVLTGHTMAATGVSVSPDGDTIASASTADGIFLWGLPAG